MVSDQERKMYRFHVTSMDSHVCSASARTSYDVTDSRCNYTTDVEEEEMKCTSWILLIDQTNQEQMGILSPKCVCVVYSVKDVTAALCRRHVFRSLQCKPQFPTPSTSKCMINASSTTSCKMRDGDMLYETVVNVAAVGSADVLT